MEYLKIFYQQTGDTYNIKRGRLQTRCKTNYFNSSTMVYLLLRYTTYLMFVNSKQNSFPFLHACNQGIPKIFPSLFFVFSTKGKERKGISATHTSKGFIFFFAVAHLFPLQRLIKGKQFLEGRFRIRKNTVM